jgi:5-methylcytosine-specific restriction enzyme subunit McrC
MNSLSLREGDPSTRLVLDEATASTLQSLKVATVSPAGHGEWWVSNIARVGVVRIGAAEIRIEPKVPISRLFYLLARTSGWDAWRDEDVTLDSIDDLYPAIAGLFARTATTLLRHGVLRSYRTERRSEPFVRGRWLVGEQIRLRQGLPLPAELSIDEYTEDVAENQILKSAARRALRSVQLAPAVRRGLHLIDHLLADVSVLTRGIPLPPVRLNRLNSRYGASLALARLILEDASLDHESAETSASGFLLTMSSVFERFIEVEITESAQLWGGRVKPQHTTHLDRDLLVEVKPDLVWMDPPRVLAVFDAKYKAEKPAGYPNADIYQMLAYCVHHRIGSGHLVYAAGNESPARYSIDEAGVMIICHALNLDASPEEIRAQIDAIVREAALATQFPDAPEAQAS